MTTAPFSPGTVAVLLSPHKLARVQVVDERCADARRTAAVVHGWELIFAGHRSARCLMPDVPPLRKVRRVRQRSAILALASLLFLGCGGDGGDPADGIAVDAIADLYAGRYADFFDAAHRSAQVTTTRAAFISCAARQGGTVPDVKVSKVAATDETYTSAPGKLYAARAVTVRVSARGQATNVVVWMVDRRVADVVSEGEQEGDQLCMKRL